MSSSTTSTVWADTPFPLIPIPALNKAPKSLTPAEYMAQDMANAHSSLLRSLNALYNQAPYVSSSKDIRDLLQYGKYWCQWIEEHHTAEEKYLFPKIEEVTEEKGLMEGNVDQHHAFGPGLAIFEKYVNETTTEEYDGKKLQSVIEGFAYVFAEHMKDEIDTLLSLEKYEKIDWRKINDDFVTELRKGSSLALFPLVLGAGDRSVMPWPELPFFLPYVCHYIFSWKDRGTWRFSPSSVWGERRPLLFTAETQVR